MSKSSLVIGKTIRFRLVEDKAGLGEGVITRLGSGDTLSVELINSYAGYSSGTEIDIFYSEVL